MARLAWIALLGGTLASAQMSIQYDKLTPAQIEERLRAGEVLNSQREPKLRGLFEDAGCAGERLTEQPVKHVRAPNIICVLRGETDSAIIVGGHFDFVDRGKGILDNWSGASLLPSFYESLRKLPRRHTFLFIGFAAEEEGLIGSKYYVHAMTKEQAERTSAMVNLDSVGSSSTKIELDRGDKRLANSLAAMASTFKLPLNVVNVHKVGRSDSDSFEDRKIPTINIHSVTNETFPILHTSRDTLAVMHLSEYYDTYRLVAAYLAYLDQLLDAPSQTPGPQH